jgi:hypothetical protein
VAVGDGNGFLVVGNKARAVASVIVAIAAAGAVLFGVFSFGVSYATSDLRAASVTAAAKNASQDAAIESIGGQMYRVEQRLFWLSVSLDPASTADERRNALRRMRAIGAGIPTTE